MIDVANGNSIPQLQAALDEAERTKGQPTLLIANTVKGCGAALMENKTEWHHKVPTEAEYAQIMAELAARKEALAHE